jgi:hypothetical protein
MQNFAGNNDAIQLKGTQEAVSCFSSAYFGPAATQCLWRRDDGFQLDFPWKAIERPR